MKTVSEIEQSFSVYLKTISVSRNRFHNNATAAQQCGNKGDL
jgi:hypothetical protein